MKNVCSVAKAIILALLALVTVSLLVEYAIDDAKQRSTERQALRIEAQLAKKHPLVLKGCETDTECEQLDELLETIHASHQLD